MCHEKYSIFFHFYIFNRAHKVFLSRGSSYSSLSNARNRVESYHIHHDDDDEDDDESSQYL